MHKVIDSAINGDDAAEFGSRVFDLSKEGVNLKIKCESQGDFPTFVSSRFTSPSDLKLSESKISELLEGIHDLESIVTVKSIDELKALFNEHYLITSGSEKAEKAEPKQAAQKKASAPVEPDSDEPVQDSEIEDMLKDLV